MFKKITSIMVLLILASTVSMAQAKFGAKVFFNYHYNSDNNPTNEFELNRAYFTYQDNLDENLSYKFTTDVGRYGGDDRLSAYLKVAQLKWKTNFGSLVLGLQSMNMFKIQEGNWGYRFVEKAAMDKNKFSSSADLAIGYYHKFGKKVNFSALVSNGTGYKKSENDDYKKFSFQLYYGDSKLKKDGNFNVGAVFSTESFDYVSGQDTTTKSTNVFGGFAAYKFSKFKIGAEYDILTKGGSKDVTKNVISVYADFQATKKLNLFARFDKYDPNTDVDNDGKTYFIGGASITPGKGFSIAPNIKISSPEEGDSETTFYVNCQFKL